jgi:hypothetical protein
MLQTEKGRESGQLAVLASHRSPEREHRPGIYSRLRRPSGQQHAVCGGLSKEPAAGTGGRNWFLQSEWQWRLHDAPEVFPSDRHWTVECCPSTAGAATLIVLTSVTWA